MENTDATKLEDGQRIQNEENEGYSEYREFVVDKGQSPLRIDKYVTNKLWKVSRNRIQNGIKAGALTVNGKKVKANYKVNPLDKIELVIPRSVDASTELHADEMDLDIRYEDDDLLILHKPSGLVVHPGIGNPRGTLVNGLMHYLGQKDDLPILDGNPTNRPGLVHRIDKETSGLMVIAKTEFAMTHLAKQFFDHTIHRRYQTLVWSEPDEEKGYFEGYIGRNPSNHTTYKIFEDGEAGKWSATHWKLVERLYYVSLIECELETGRTHQIRVHMKHLGHPVFNDSKYGGDRIHKGTVYTKYKQFVHNCFKLCPRQALHAKEIGFIHPTTGEEMKFISDLPPDMQSVMEKWRKYVDVKKDIRASVE